MVVSAQIAQQLISYEKLQPIFEKLYGNTDDFTFTITGNVDLNELRPLVEKYLGSLPRTKKHYTWVDDGVRIIPGRQEYRFEMPMEQPKVTMSTVFRFIRFLRTMNLQTLFSGTPAGLPCLRLSQCISPGF